MPRSLNSRAESEFRAFCQTLQSVEEEVRRFTQSLSEHSQKRAVLILGATGSGKSTLLNLIAGQQHSYGSTSWNVDGATVYRWSVVSEESVARTSGGPVSETATPNFYRRGDVLLVDCPGFGDSRGWSRSLANHMLIDALFHHFASLQIVFVEALSNLTENRGNVLFEDLRCLFGLFEVAELRQLARCLTVVFTKGRRVSFVPLLLELLHAREAAGLINSRRLKIYEELFRALQTRGAVLCFDTPPERQQDQADFFQQTRASLENCVEASAFERLRPAAISLDPSTKLKLVEMKSAARVHFDCVWLDLMVFLRKVERGWDFQTALIALRLIAFAEYCCDALLHHDVPIGLVEGGSLRSLKEKYAAALPEDHQVVCRAVSGLLHLSLAFAAFHKAGIAVEEWEKAQIFDGCNSELNSLREKIIGRVKSYWVLGRKPVAVGAGAIGTGALGAAGFLEGATALAVSFLALPLAAIGAGSYYVAARRREMDQLIAEITPVSLLE